MAFKFLLFGVLAYTVSAALIPQQIALLQNNDGGSDLIQRQQNTMLDSRTINNEQLRRQDEYARNIDQSSDLIQSDFLRQQSNRLRDNEYRRTNYLYNNNQQQRNVYQSQEQDQISRQRPDANYLLTQLQNQLQRQLLGESFLISQATNNYPILRSWTSPYSSRVTFNSPLVSYRY